VVSEALDIWSLVVGAFVFSNETLWGHLYPTSEFHGCMVASVSQKEIDAILKRSWNFGPKEAGFLSGCLRVEPSDLLRL
jgi:hypothetical protein